MPRDDKSMRFEYGSELRRWLDRARIRQVEGDNWNNGRRVVMDSLEFQSGQTGVLGSGTVVAIYAGQDRKR